MKVHVQPRNMGSDHQDVYNELLKLLHNLYGDDVGKVLQDSKWLAQVCSQVCSAEDEKCQQACSTKKIGDVRSYINPISLRL